MILSEMADTLHQIPKLLKVAKEAKLRPLDSRDCFARCVERNAKRFARRSAVVFEGRELNWAELNNSSNRYAATLQDQGLVRGDVVSVIMENRIEFLTTIIALNKLGVTASLINTNLTGRALVHCISITESKMCLFGEERTGAIADVTEDLDLIRGEHFLYVADSGDQACPDWAVDLGDLAESAASSNLAATDEVTLGDTALYIFTSGTTGLPKASVLSNRRFLLSATLSYRGGLQCDQKDRIYLCLPLYHGTGLFLGVGAAFCSGASMFIRRKFSASQFLTEVRESGSTCFIYIGELCRYLLNTPAQKGDDKNPLKTVMGNGLRPDIWLEFKQRFGIERIAEFYGSSEGNVAFANLLNRDCTVGMTAMPVALIQYDVDADEIVYDEAGRCIRVANGEPGLLLGKITEKTVFEGYTNKEATEQKILRNVFKDGDAWFNTGDLMKTTDVGFAFGIPHYQFVDRVGDTFRWKSENVSTNEVGEIINGHPQVMICNVYGVDVPKADGKAGMASLVLTEGETALDIANFSKYVNRELPAYARPVFLRIQTDLNTTGTFKMVKGDLRKEAYDLDQVRTDPIFVMKPRCSKYELLDEAFAKQIGDGEGGF